MERNKDKNQSFTLHTPSHSPCSSPSPEMAAGDPSSALSPSRGVAGLLLTLFPALLGCILSSHSFFHGEAPSIADRPGCGHRHQEIQERKAGPVQ